VTWPQRIMSAEAVRSRGLQLRATIDGIQNQQVYEITVFVGTPAQGSPSRIVTIQFSRAALHIMAGRRQNAELEARKIAM
jgi:hypothetical protein